MTGVEIIAYHGWGFDSDCWSAWEAVLPEHTELSAYNRGYFREVRESSFSKDASLRILFTHSFGLHLCSKELFSQADLLVIFGGFTSFHPKAAQYRRRSRLVLNQMINRLRDDPDQVLKKFYQNVFSPQESRELPEGSMNKALLLEDLARLNNEEMDIQRLNNIPKICILHGYQDNIVPRIKGRELHEEIWTEVKYLEVKNAGHALPFTHTDRCWAFIKPEIAELIVKK